MDSNKKIDTIRKQIDTTDREIVQLLHKRLNYAKEIGVIKKKCHQNDSLIEFIDPIREKKIYQQLLIENNAVFPEKVLRKIFSEIILACRNIQQQQK